LICSWRCIELKMIDENGIISLSCKYSVLRPKYDDLIVTDWQNQ
jgi:hypothetical protein